MPLQTQGTVVCTGAVAVDPTASARNLEQERQGSSSSPTRRQVAEEEQPAMRVRLLLLSSLLLAAPAGAAPALISSLAAGLGTSGGTTAGLNTSGTNFEVVAVCGVNGHTPTVASSPANTWTNIAASSATSTNTNVNLFYATNATGGASQTFTIGGSFVSTCIQAFNGVATTTPYQTATSTNIPSGTVITPPSITPTGSSLLISAATLNGAEATISINSSYVLTSSAPFAGGANYGCACAYDLTSTLTNPSWTYATNTDIAADLLSFTAASTPASASSGVTFSPGSGKITISPGSGQVTF